MRKPCNALTSTDAENVQVTGLRLDSSPRERGTTCHMTRTDTWQTQTRGRACHVADELPSSVAHGSSRHMTDADTWQSLPLGRHRQLTATPPRIPPGVPSPTGAVCARTVLYGFPSRSRAPGRRRGQIPGPEIDSEPFSAHTQGFIPLLLSAGFSSPIDVKVN